MFLDSEPEGEIQLPRSGMPLKEKKRTATLLTATEKIYMFLSSSPSVTKGKPFFFSSVKGSVHSHAIRHLFFQRIICMRGTRCRRVNGTKMKKLQCKAIDGFPLSERA